MGSPILLPATYQLRRLELCSHKKETIVFLDTSLSAKKKKRARQPRSLQRGLASPFADRPLCWPSGILASPGLLAVHSSPVCFCGHPSARASGPHPSLVCSTYKCSFVVLEVDWIASRPPYLHSNPGVAAGIAAAAVTAGFAAAAPGQAPFTGFSAPPAPHPPGPASSGFPPHAGPPCGSYSQSHFASPPSVGAAGFPSPPPFSPPTYKSTPPSPEFSGRSRSTKHPPRPSPPPRPPSEGSTPAPKQQGRSAATADLLAKARAARLLPQAPRDSVSAAQGGAVLLEAGETFESLLVVRPRPHHKRTSLKTWLVTRPKLDPSPTRQVTMSLGKSLGKW